MGRSGSDLAERAAGPLRFDAPAGSKGLAGCWTKKDGGHVVVGPHLPTPGPGGRNPRNWAFVVAFAVTGAVDAVAGHGQCRARNRTRSASGRTDQSPATVVVRIGTAFDRRQRNIHSWRVLPFHVLRSSARAPGRRGRGWACSEVLWEPDSVGCRYQALTFEPSHSSSGALASLASVPSGAPSKAASAVAPEKTVPSARKLVTRWPTGPARFAVPPSGHRHGVDHGSGSAPGRARRRCPRVPGRWS